jgi:hypothetical protein
MIKQAFAKMREISIRVACRRHALIHLHDVYALPGNIFASECTEHDPRSTTAADGHYKLGACSNGGACFSGNEPRRRFGGGFVIGKYFKVHRGFSFSSLPGP